MQLISIFKQLPAEAEPLILELTNRIGKLRALDDEESKLLEIAIRREARRSGRRTHEWTRSDDRIVLRANTMSSLRVAAMRIGVTIGAARLRRDRLRKTCASQNGMEGV